jgi:hypothetical protein
MSSMTAGDERSVSDEPTLTVAAEAVERTEDPSIWRIRWRLTNRDAVPLRISAAWLPHGRFRGQRQEFDPPLTLSASGGARFDSWVRADEAPGAVVENCFVILSVEWAGEQWRVFARLEVTFQADASPKVDTVLITAHPVGFSG